jgi:Ca2+-transporting ATPase
MTKTESSAGYRWTVEEVVAGLGSDAWRGLSSEEACARLKRYGPNELEAEKPVPTWRRFLAQFRDTLVILLLIATAVSVGLWAYERDSALPYEGLAIFAIVLLNGILGYVQESRAERAVAALRAMSAAEASVVRDGERRSALASELVPGDVILVEEGDTIPADARLIQSTALQASEASLTGESLPVHKDVRPIEEEVGLGDRSNMVFSGTAATYGRGRAMVTATGMQTELGKVAGLLRRTEDEATPLQKELDRTGKLLGAIVLVIAAVYSSHHLARRRGARPRGDLRRPDPGCRARCGRGAGRATGHRHCGARDRGAADGAPQRDRAQAARGRNSGFGHRDRLGQDRNPDEK